MKISLSTPTFNLNNPSTGYGYAASNMLKSLNSLGHEVYFQDSTCDFQINFSQPQLFKLHKNQYQIAYIPWESTVIPNEWFTKLNLCDEVWTTSDWCANVFEDNGIKNVKVYPHGIDSVWKPKKRIQGDVIKFLHIGEPAPRKAGQMVIDAFTSLFGNDPRYSLTIKAYKNNTTRIYNNYIDKSIIGLPDKIYNNIKIITDEIDESQLVGLYHNHDVLVYPSYGEGFGFIPLQALATGMPTICTSGWAHYENYLGPLKLKSELIDSPWPHPHTGKVLEPNYKHLLEVMRDVAHNFKAYSGFYFAQSTKIHNDYNWLQLTNKSFDQVIQKFN